MLVYGNDSASDYLSLTSTRPRQRAQTDPHRPSTQRKRRNAQRASRDNVPQFVRSYLDERQFAEDMCLKKSHFIPEILHPKPSTLPEAGAAVPASSLALLKRRQKSNATYVVSAKLVGVSTEAKQKAQNRMKRKQNKQSSLSILDELPWRNTRDFAKWQNRIFKAELDKAASELSPDALERTIAHPTVLRIRGSKIQKPDTSLDFDSLQNLIGDIKDQKRIEKARERIRGCNAQMQASSMKVLKQIANARIAKFGCQEPGLVTDKKVLEFLKTKPRPKTPRVIEYTTKHMDALMEERRLAEIPLQELDVDLDANGEDEYTVGPFLTQVSINRTRLLEN